MCDANRVMDGSFLDAFFPSGSVTADVAAVMGCLSADELAFVYRASARGWCSRVIVESLQSERILFELSR